MSALAISSQPRKRSVVQISESRPGHFCIDPPFAKLIRGSWIAKVVVMSERSTEQLREWLDSLYCQDPSRIHAIKGVEPFAYLFRGTLGHDDDFSNPATPNQFGKRRIDAKCPSRDSEIWSNRTASSVDAKSPMHSLSFVQAQRFRV